MKYTTNKITIQGRVYSFGEANGRNMLEVKTVKNTNIKGESWKYLTINYKLEEESEVEKDGKKGFSSKSSFRNMVSSSLLLSKCIDCVEYPV